MTGEFLGKLRDTLGNIIGKVATGTLEEKYSGRVPDEHVLVHDAAGKLVPMQAAAELKSNQTYLQVVINHMFVKQDRQLWVQREHLGAVWMGLRYAGMLRSVPFMVGRELLVDKVRDLPAGARIEFQDVRVGRMYPYTGDGLALYLGLWSTPTINWASTMFSALDTIAGRIKVAASLSQVLEMVDVLNQGISMVLGLNAIQAHLNLYQEFQDPSSGEVGVLRPGFFVMLDAPKATFDASALRIVDGKLCSVGADGQPAPYFEHDFLLYSITSQTQLSSAVDMFASQYDLVMSHLIGSKSDAARLALAAQEYHTLQTQIVTSPDLTRTDKNRLIAYFGESLNADALALAVNLKSTGVAFTPGGRPRLPANVPRVSQAGFEGVHLDAEAELTDPRLTAGRAAARFSDRLGQAVSA